MKYKIQVDCNFKIKNKGGVMMDEPVDIGQTAPVEVEIEANIGDLFGCNTFQELMDKLDEKPETSFMISSPNPNETRKMSTELINGPKNYGEMKKLILKVAMQRKSNPNADQRAIKNLLKANNIPSFKNEKFNEGKNGFREKVATLIMNLSVGEIGDLVKNYSSLFGRNEF